MPIFALEWLMKTEPTPRGTHLLDTWLCTSAWLGWNYLPEWIMFYRILNYWVYKFYTFDTRIDDSLDFYMLGYLFQWFVIINIKKKNFWKPVLSAKQTFIISFIVCYFLSVVGAGLSTTKIKDLWLTNSFRFLQSAALWSFTYIRLFFKFGNPDQIFYINWALQRS